MVYFDKLYINISLLVLSVPDNWKFGMWKDNLFSSANNLVVLSSLIFEDLPTVCS